MDWEAKCGELQKRVAELEEENRELRRRLGISEMDQPMLIESPKTEAQKRPSPPMPSVHMRSTPEEKIHLFRSCFRGREDVFARRWYSPKTEKSGYSPVCANEWKYGVCIKPKGKCSKCENRVLVPLDDAVIFRHLSGKAAHGEDVIGLYPILPDDTCYFLASDFDDGDWQENVAAVRNVCSEWEIPCAVERSRSGEGAHLWTFFTDAVPCTDARKLGSALLTAAMEQEGKLKLDAYDRMFPCQDTLPSGGFGNLIALPLQGQARKKGNSLFVDELFRPYPDQWAYLSEIPRLTPEEVDAQIKAHSHGDALGSLCAVEPTAKPWEKQCKVSLAAIDFYGVQHIVRANMLYIPANGFSARVRNQILQLAAFRNPDFYKSQAMRLPIYDKPRIICAAEERDGFLALPRCCEAALVELLESAGAVYEIEDQTNAGNPIRVSFKGGLREDQIPAAESLLEHKNGALSATTAFGKTVIAAYLIGQRKVNGLTATPTRQDGHQPIIHMQCGPIRYQVDAKAQAEKRPFVHAVIPRFTEFAQPLADEHPWKITDAYAAMQTDEERNRKIISDVLDVITTGRTPLVLTERYDHAKLLAELLTAKGQRVVLLSGKGTAKEKQELLQELARIPADEPLTLVATGRYIGEGFDYPRLDTLFLAMPISWKGTLAQYAGRLHRNYEGKQEVLIYDYVDTRVPMLERMYQKRLTGYAAIGYTVRGEKANSSAANRIFSQEEYWGTFSEDVRNAQKEIVVVSPYLHMGQVKQFLALIPENVHVTVVTSDESGFKPETWQKICKAVQILEDNSAEIQFQPKVYQQYAVIDKCILWYGGINYLGFEKAANGAMRLSSPELAKELMDIIHNEDERQITLPGV